MAVTGEQSGDQKKEVNTPGVEAVQGQEQAGARATQEQQQKRETTEAEQAHNAKRAETAQNAAAARAGVLAEAGSAPAASATPSATPTTAAPENASSTDSAAASVTTTAAAADTNSAQGASSNGFGDKLKGIGENLSGFLTDLWGKLKTAFSSMSAKFSGWMDKRKVGKKDNETDTTASTSTQDTQRDKSTDASVSAATTTASEVATDANDTTRGLKGSALFSNAQFSAKAAKVAKKIGVSQSALYGIIKIESGGDPAARNPSSNASGLIQWMPFVSRGMYKLEPEQVRSMTGLQQLDMVDKYFSGQRGRLKTFSDLYRAVFWSASIGKATDYVFGTSKTSAAKVAKQNAGIAKFSTRSDGLIDNRCFEAFCASRRPSGVA